MKTIEYIFIPARTYRGEVELQLDACTSLEEAHNLAVEKCDELFQGCTPEEMWAVIQEGPKANVYSLSHMHSGPEDHPDQLLYYPDGNGNWPLEIKRVKLRTPIQVNLNKHDLVQLWLDSEEENRTGTDESIKKCLEMKDKFMEEMKKLSEEDQEYVKDYLDSVGG
jgi:hypothetical protein